MPSLSDIGSAIAGAASGASTPGAHGQPGFQNTRVIASFHSDEGFDGVIDWKRRSPDKPPPFHIQGFTSQKMLGGQPGYWQLSVKAHENQDLMRLWEDPEDVWVRIAVVRNDVATEVVFGLVSTITETTARTGPGARVAQYAIEGLDFQKVLLQTQLLYNIYNPALLAQTLMFQALGGKDSGSPGEIVQRLLSGWLGNEGNSNKQWMLPKSLGGGSFYDLLAPRIQIEGKLRGFIKDPAIYHPDQFYGRGLWDLLEEWANGMLNEMYCGLDIGNRNLRRAISQPATFDPKRLPQPAFFLRERPFPSKDRGDRAWNKLNTTKLGLEDIQQRQVSKGAPESRFNFWQLNPQGVLSQSPNVLAAMNQAAAKTDGAPGSYPTFSSESIQRHGLRQFTQQTRYLQYEVANGSSWFRQSAQWLQLLHDWYAIGPYELAGSLTTTTLFPQVQIGERVTEERRAGKPVTYYVEGVSHNWQYPGPGYSVLNVTRGAYEDKPLLDIVYQHVNSTALGVLGALGSVDELFPTDGLTDAAFPDEVPHGSGVRLDRQVGQVDPPEVVYLRRRGIEPRSATSADRGELENPDEESPRAVTTGDLPDRVTPDEDLQQVGLAPATDERAPNGNLTQRQLEQGVPFPVREEGQTDVEPARTSTQDSLIRPRGRVAGAKQ